MNGSISISRLAGDIRAIGRELHDAAASAKPRLYRGFNGMLLKQAMDDERLRAALFQLIDTMPQLADAGAVAAHMRAYLNEVSTDGLTGWLLRLGAHPSLAWVVQRQARQMARQFLAEETEAGLARVLASLARVPALATVDAVGEAVLTEAEADAYLARNLHLLGVLSRLGVDPPNVSLKLSALTPRFDPLDMAGTRRRVFDRLTHIVAAAEARGATLTVDMEHYEYKPLIMYLFDEMLLAWPSRQWHAAIALQAYLPETQPDVERLIDATQRHGRRIGIRLVKGAYWDQECAWAAQRHWPKPVFLNKAETDVMHECLTLRLLENADCLHPAIASHNLRNQAVALACARRLGLALERWEAQMIFGMAEPLRDAVAAAGASLRVYVPVGDAVVGIAYLIRRLIENTASTSVLRQSYSGEDDFARVIAAPIASTREPGQALATSAGFSNLPLIDFSREEEQREFRDTLARVSETFPRRHSTAVTGGRHLSRNPANPEQLLGETDLAVAADADAAIALASASFPSWRDTRVAERARLMRRAADLMTAERHTLAALEVFEAARNWREADADVAEAIDHMRYYAAEMERLAGWQATVIFPGEDNRVSYAPRGVAVVISPWNFPFAILAGMTSAALVAGNSVIMKPALPGLLAAHAFLDVLRRAGLPPDVCQLLPGGAEVGEALVRDPRTHVIAFTGSRAVGLRILRLAHTPAPAQRHIKQVVCEMGGKNAIIADDDADLDEAVTGILASAFGYAGQKCSACSRLIVVGAVRERLLARLIDAAAALSWGDPADPANVFGPLITPEAQRKALDYIEIGKTEGRLAWQGSVPAEGWYVPPTIIDGIRPEHRLAREEIFGPVLAVMAAADFETALDMAMDSDYALTGGVYSRYPPHLRLAEERFRVGNLYLNRKITGARVSIQPFGGFALSGTGVQAGGGDYLKQFLWSRSISANTMRHGFIAGDRS